jgi:ribosomal protein S12 methylthiotransferase accessory factor
MIDLLRERTLTEVLELISQFKSDIGVTRLANITHLDNIGIPVFCSYRPQGILLQANGGKGLSKDHAKCSAMMEALEYSHMEKILITTSVQYISHNKLSNSGASILTYKNLEAAVSDFYSPRLPIGWISLLSLINGGYHMCPADLVYITNQSFSPCHTNGLSSGNTNNESILHGILELVERDAYARILVNGKLDIRGVGRRIDTNTLEDPVLSNLVELIESTGSRLYLILLPSSIPVYSFWGIIIDEYSVVPVGAFNFGLGCHPNPVVAATRAITEAAQSRLIFIHGNREDIRHKAVFSDNYVVKSSIYHFFQKLDTHNFDSLCTAESPCLGETVDTSLSLIIEQLIKHGFDKIFYHILRDESQVFSVTKTFIPGMRCEMRFL